MKNDICLDDKKFFGIVNTLYDILEIVVVIFFILVYEFDYRAAVKPIMVGLLIKLDQYSFPRRFSPVGETVGSCHCMVWKPACCNAVV